jgi:hypothetical protein
MLYYEVKRVRRKHLGQGDEAMPLCPRKSPEFRAASPGPTWRVVESSNQELGGYTTKTLDSAWTPPSRIPGFPLATLWLESFMS